MVALETALLTALSMETRSTGPVLKSLVTVLPDVVSETQLTGQIVRTTTVSGRKSGRVRSGNVIGGAASYIKGIFESQYLRIRKQINSRDN